MFKNEGALSVIFVGSGRGFGASSRAIQISFVPPEGTIQYATRSFDENDDIHHGCSLGMRSQRPLSRLYKNAAR